MLTKEVAPAVLGTPRGPDQGGMHSMTTSSVLREELLRTILREATQRYNHELLDDEERQLLLDRIRRLRGQLKLARRGPGLFGLRPFVR